MSFQAYDPEGKQPVLSKCVFLRLSNVQNTDHSASLSMYAIFRSEFRRCTLTDNIVHASHMKLFPVARLALHVLESLQLLLTSHSLHLVVKAHDSVSAQQSGVTCESSYKFGFPWDRGSCSKGQGQSCILTRYSIPSSYNSVVQRCNLEFPI